MASSTNIAEVTDREFEVAWADPDNRRIVARAVRRFRDKIAHDELTYLAQMAMFKSLLDYRPDSGKKFTTFLYERVVWQCQHAMRQERCRPKYLPLRFASSLCISTPPDVYYVRDCLSSMHPAQARLLVDYHLGRMTLQEIAQREVCSAVSILKRLRQAEATFRRLYREN